MRKPLNLVHIDTDSYIEGSLLNLISCLSLSSFVSIRDPYLFNPIRKYFIISVFAIQYRWIFHNIYMPLLLDYHFSQAIWWNTRTVDSFFFRLSFCLYEWKQKKGVSHYDLDFISMGCIFFLQFHFDSYPFIRPYKQYPI